MPFVTLPPAITERRSDEREVFFLINALRRRLIDLTNPTSGAAAAILSMRIGRGDIFSDSSGNELIIDQFELPVAVKSFGVTIAGRASSASGSLTVRVRLGGTDGLATDGDVIAEIVAPSPLVQRVASTPVTVANASLDTLIKITGQSAAGHLGKFYGGTLAIN